jgi:hypothetical protein
MLALLLQESLDIVGVLRFFAGFFLILCIYVGALLFTYWISKGE